MPTNKDAFIRYRVINKCLTNRQKKYPSLEEIRAACSMELGTDVSYRTIQDDIYRMRNDEGIGFIAPISFSKANNGYYYSEESYSIDNIPLNEEDMDALRFAVSVLAQFRETSILKKINGAVDKLDQAVKINRLQPKDSENMVVEIETNPSTYGSEHLEVLIESITERNRIKIEYKAFGENTSKFYIVDPYLLKEYKSRWYLVSFSPEVNNFRTFGLERILRVEKLSEVFIKKDEFSPTSYFKYSFGITNLGTKPEKVILAFTQNQAYYIRTKPLHHSQKELYELKGLIYFEITVSPSYELISEILSFGAEVKVIEPKSLIKSVIDQLRKNLENYPEHI